MNSLSAFPNINTYLFDKVLHTLRCVSMWASASFALTRRSRKGRICCVIRIFVERITDCIFHRRQCCWLLDYDATLFYAPNDKYATPMEYLAKRITPLECVTVLVCVYGVCVRAFICICSQRHFRLCCCQLFSELLVQNETGWAN